MPIHEQLIDLQVLADNRASGADYAVYLYIKNKLISVGREIGLSRYKIKHGYDPNDYESFMGISRDEIRNNTRYTLKQVGRTIQRLKALELAIPDAEDNGRYYYQVRFRLPFIDDKPKIVEQSEIIASDGMRFSIDIKGSSYIFSPVDIYRCDIHGFDEAEILLTRTNESDLEWRIRQIEFLFNDP